MDFRPKSPRLTRNPLNFLALPRPPPRHVPRKCQTRAPGRSPDGRSRAQSRSCRYRLRSLWSMLALWSRPIMCRRPHLRPMGGPLRAEMMRKRPPARPSPAPPQNRQPGQPGQFPAPDSGPAPIDPRSGLRATAPRRGTQPAELSARSCALMSLENSPVTNSRCSRSSMSSMRLRPLDLAR